MNNKIDDNINRAIRDGIYGGIKKGIEVTLSNGCYASSVILIYAGIEAMAYLSRPKGKQYVTKEDFIMWANKYINIDKDSRISGEEFYSARCATLHTFGVESRGTISGSVRKIGYMIGGNRKVVYNASVDKGIVLIEINALANAFFIGIDNFIINLFADKDLSSVAEARLNTILVASPYEDVKKRIEGISEYRGRS